MSNYICPECRTQIALDDVNPSKDIALCRACGKTSSFAAVAQMLTAGMELPDTPPKCVQVLPGFAGETIIHYRRISPLLLFFVPFTAIWGGVSIGGIYGKMLMTGNVQTDEVLFGLPFLIGTIIMLGIIAFLGFGKAIITMSKGQGSIFMGVMGFGWKRRFNYDRTTTVSMQFSGARVNNVPQKAIAIETDGQATKFGSFWKEEAKQYVAALIMREISRIR